jgi:predicted metal-dependent RNase
MLINGRTEMVKIGIELVTIDGFSGHSDRRQLLDFVDQMSPTPKAIVCHHGDYHKCNDMERRCGSATVAARYAPRNLETVRLF